MGYNLETASGGEKKISPAGANLVGGANLLGRQIYLAQGTDNLLAVMVVRIYSAHQGAKYAAP
jgi:hypothetical protein